ncbi:hypothetical protein Nepgr_008004 [Nepenthes gracilis]|uniref:Uncharacterized protein n=1 Tax=Nepenthes gracilis TaxID=150966 RepID=A0AAD3XIV5_NEPGR|nr:hypothetical protein Nepgr_008004 [Nepenthes gracilis]
MPAHQAKMHTSSCKINRKSKRDRNNPPAYFFIIVFKVDSSDGRGLKSTRPQFPQENRKKSHRLQHFMADDAVAPLSVELCPAHLCLVESTAGWLRKGLCCGGESYHAGFCRANETPITKTIRTIRLDRQLKVQNTNIATTIQTIEQLLMTATNH